MIISVHWCFSSHWFLFFFARSLLHIRTDHRSKDRTKGRKQDRIPVEHKAQARRRRQEGFQRRRISSTNVGQRSVEQRQSNKLKERVDDAGKTDRQTKKTDRQKYRQIYTAIFSLAWIRFDVVSLSRIDCNPKCVKFMFSSN